MYISTPENKTFQEAPLRMHVYVTVFQPHTMVESENLLLILDGYKILYQHKYINTARLNSIVVLTT